MNKFKLVVVTALVTMGMTLFGVGLYSVNSGIVTISERGDNHTKVVIIDGNEVERETYFEHTGYEVKVNYNNSMKIGK